MNLKSEKFLTFETGGSMLVLIFRANFFKFSIIIRCYKKGCLGNFSSHIIKICSLDAVQFFVELSVFVSSIYLLGLVNKCLLRTMIKETIIRKFVLKI